MYEAHASAALWKVSRKQNGAGVPEAGLAHLLPARLFKGSRPVSAQRCALELAQRAYDFAAGRPDNPERLTNGEMWRRELILKTVLCRRVRLVLSGRSVARSRVSVCRRRGCVVRTSCRCGVRATGTCDTLWGRKHSGRRFGFSFLQGRFLVHLCSPIVA